MNHCRSVLLAVTLAIAACDPQPSAVTGPPPEVTVMAFNVQNLFDNVDDPGKDDKAYLPLSAKQNDAHIAECNTIEVESWRNECLALDWNDAAVEHKLAVVAEAILQVGDGRGADVIALQEVENAAILERLRTGFMADAGYRPAILIEGADVRGIDVAFLTRLPVVGDPVLHALDLPDEFADREGDTRGVLEATFELPDGSRLTGFSVHFPAPFHPTAIEDAQQGMLERFVRPFWQVAHDACDGCPGTHYYARDDSWSFLDMVLYAPASGGAAWQIKSVELANRTPAQVTGEGTPNRYRSAERSGVSDHWPIVATLERAP